MTNIALFHSALGVRDGVRDAAKRLTSAGHTVTIVDQYDGTTFSEYSQGAAHYKAIGYPTLMQRALDGVTTLPDGFITIGFSNGGGMAEYVATQRRVSRVILLSGTLPLEMLGADGWPSDVPVQTHYMSNDPFRQQEWVDSLVSAVTACGARIEVYDYPGTGHLFTDPSLQDEYDPLATELLWSRVLSFCGSSD